MATWTIRTFRIDDYDGARALWVASKGIGLDESDSRDRIEVFLTRNPGLSFVADLDGAIVGAVLCGQDGRRALVYHLAVAEERRRQGVGAALVRACLESLRAQGIRKCHIMVFGDNHEALRFWKHVGAKERTDLVLSSIATAGAV
jgi:ribosomal protein S18 acetylase RimI-like enzyme